MARSLNKICKTQDRNSAYSDSHYISPMDLGIRLTWCYIKEICGPIDCLAAVWQQTGLDPGKEHKIL